MDGTTLAVIFLGVLGWSTALVCAACWWLTSRADAHERELVNGLNQLHARLEQRLPPQA